MEQTFATKLCSSSIKSTVPVEELLSVNSMVKEGKEGKKKW